MLGLSSLVSTDKLRKARERPQSFNQLPVGAVQRLGGQGGDPVIANRTSRRYTRGSKLLGIEPGEYARVEQVDARENRITIDRENGEHQTYDPRRLAGVAVYHETERAFSEGDRVQFTAPSKGLHVANRELGTIEKINDTGDVRICMDSGRQVAFNIRDHPHLDHGYAVTSHSSQGQTAARVLTHVDTDKSEPLINNRFAYVSVSRGQYDAEIYTNDKSDLGRDLSRDVTQRTAIPSHGQEPTEMAT